MPPKKLDAAKLFGKEKKIFKKKAKENLSIDDITVDLVKNTTEITDLRKWAGPKFFDLNIPMTKNENIIKEELIKAINARKAENANIMNEEKHEDNDKEAQLEAIEHFLESYLENRNKTSRVYGEYGARFVEIWKSIATIAGRIKIAREYRSYKTFSMLDEVVMNVLEYIEANYKNLPKTPQEFVKNYIEKFNSSIEDEDALMLFNMADYSDIVDKNFLKSFEKLDEVDKIKFSVKFLADYNDNIDFNRYLKNYIESKKNENKEPIPPSETVLAAGVQEYPIIERKNQDDRLKVKKDQIIERLKTFKWQIKDRDDKWVSPEDKFYDDIATYGAHMKNPKQYIIIINGNEFDIKQLPSEDSNKKDKSPTELYKDLIFSFSGNVLDTLPIEWILDTPLFFLDSIYLDQPSKLLESRTQVNFSNLIHNMQSSLRNETFKTYLEKFLYMFFPFFIETKFFIIEHVNNGYISVNNYSLMEIHEKVPEIALGELKYSIQMYLDDFFKYIINSAYKYTGFIPIKILTNLSDNSNFDCPAEWFPKDLIVHNKFCYSIPELASRFENDDYSDPYNRDLKLDDSLIERLKKYYITKEYRETKFIKKIDGDLADKVFFVNKNLYDIKNPPPEPKKKVENVVSKEDLNVQFYKYYKTLNAGLLNPSELISTLKEVNLISTCETCKEYLTESKIESLQNRTDGSNIKIKFCDLKCMGKHTFKTVESVRDLIPKILLDTTTSSVINRV